MTGESRERRVVVRGDLDERLVVGDYQVVIDAQHRSAITEFHRARIFVSYVHDDLTAVNRLVDELTAAGFSVWMDTRRLRPGMRWRSEIQKAIEAGDFFLACFSPRYWHRESYMHEELLVAVERLRRMPRDQTWFIPVKLAECELPDHPIGPGETISNTMQYADLGTDWAEGLRQLMAALAPPGDERPGQPRRGSSPCRGWP